MGRGHYLSVGGYEYPGACFRETHLPACRHFASLGAYDDHGRGDLSEDFPGSLGGPGHVNGEKGQGGQDDRARCSHGRPLLDAVAHGSIWVMVEHSDPGPAMS